MSDYLALYRSYLTTEKRMSANTVSSYMRDLSPVSYTHLDVYKRQPFSSDKMLFA